MTQLLSPFVGETRFSIQLAERVRAQSASVSCARVRTAMQLAALRFEHINITRPVVRPEQLDALPELSSRALISVVIDHFRHAELLSDVMRSTGHMIGVLIDVDVGLQSTGLKPGTDTARLAMAASGLPGLRFVGVHVDDRDDSCADLSLVHVELSEMFRMAIHAKRSIEVQGLTCSEIASGYRCSSEQLHATGVTIALSEATDSPILAPRSPSAAVRSTVLSRPSFERCVLDVGRADFGAASRIAMTRPAGATIHRIMDDATTLLLAGESLDLAIGDEILLHCFD